MSYNLTIVEELKDRVIEEIKSDVEMGDTSPIYELISYIPVENLIAYLPEEEWKYYKSLV